MSSRDESGGRRHLDPILGHLGEAMRGAGVRDPFGALDPSDQESLEALAAGRLDQSAASALHARVAAGELPQAAWEAMQPLSEGDRAAMVDAMFAARDQRREQPPAPPAPAAPETGGNVTPIGPATTRKKRRRGPVGPLLLSTALLAAAAASFLVLWPTPPGALPAYWFDVEGVDRELRGAPDDSAGELVLGPGARLRLILRPEDAVQGAVEARAFTRIGDTVTPSTVAAQPQGNGVFLIDARREELFAAATGRDAELLLVTARPGYMPEARALQQSKVTAGSRVTRVRVRLR